MARLLVNVHPRRLNAVNWENVSAPMPTVLLAGFDPFDAYIPCGLRLAQ